ncbi:MAG: hypothetical protein EU540_08195 [Promethearchaeota archaeon]|nr:MAG: hypothetical protein EU540_08195 [Candidatus Lokiarchaeota archaeon]
MSETEEKESVMSQKSRLTLQIAGGAIFGALSLVLAFLAAFLPRTPEGFAYFDPISIIWVICYLIFGPLAGLISAIIGMLLLMPFDPFAPIGPLMKFTATTALILPSYLLMRYIKKDVSSGTLKEPKIYATYGVIGIIVRIAIMVPFNIVIYLALGYPSELLGSYLIFVVLFNILQSVWDLVIPYLIVYGAKIDEKFEIW